MPALSPRFTICHIVTFNSAAVIRTCLQSLLAQTGFTLHADFEVLVTDNHSSDDTLAVLTSFGNQITVRPNQVNTGFCDAHNEGLAWAIAKGARYTLLLNPDVRLEPDALSLLVNQLQGDTCAGTACPKLLRADADLNPVEPRTFDSTGMFMTPAIRHFDRASQQRDQGQYDRSEYVFGATGAAILVRTECVIDAALGRDEQYVELFDSSFFAYREDADLAWRLQRLGWKCRYVPQARAYHERRVLPERRTSLPAELNRYSVRNRFLLQVNHFSFAANLHCILPTLWRNLLVVAGVVCFERTSLPALREALCLLPEALRKRRLIAQRVRKSAADVARWFSARPYAEPALDTTPSRTPIGKVSVIIVNFNSGSRLAEGLASLLRDEDTATASPEIEIFAVDNASTDDSFTQARLQFGAHPKVRWLAQDRNLGFAGGINSAAAAATGDALLILNPDIRISRAALAILASTLTAYQSLGLVAPLLCGQDGAIQRGFTVRRFPTADSTLAEWFYLHRLWPTNPWTVSYLMTSDRFFERYIVHEQPSMAQPYENPLRPLLVEQPAAACILVRREAFDAAGGFDSAFWPAWFEDVDFCRRLAVSGWQVAVTAEATAAHEGGYSAKALEPAEYALAYYQNQLRYWRKHSSGAPYATLRVLFSVAMVLRAAVALAGSLFTREPARTRRLAATLALLAFGRSPHSSAKQPPAGGSVGSGPAA